MDLNRFSALSSSVVQLVLGCAAAWVLGALIWQIFNYETPTLNTARSSADASAERNPTELSLSALRLFGQDESTGALGFGSASEGSGPFSVVGTLTGHEARAFIAMDNGEQRALGIDGSLPGGGTIAEIEADHIVIVRNGKRTRVALSKPESLSSVAPVRSGNRQSSMQRSRAAVPGIRTSSSGSRTATPSFSGNPLDLAGDIRALPYRENGRQIGVRLQAGSSGDLLARMGLRSTDVITSVNGISLDSPARSMEVLQQLTSSNNLTVGVRRNGQPVTLNINLNDS